MQWGSLSTWAALPSCSGAVSASFCFSGCLTSPDLATCICLLAAEIEAVYPGCPQSCVISPLSGSPCLLQALFLPCPSPAPLFAIVAFVLSSFTSLYTAQVPTGVTAASPLPWLYCFFWLKLHFWGQGLCFQFDRAGGQITHNSLEEFTGDQQTAHCLAGWVFCISLHLVFVNWFVSEVRPHQNMQRLNLTEGRCQFPLEWRLHPWFSIACPVFLYMTLLSLHVHDSFLTWLFFVSWTPEPYRGSLLNLFCSQTVVQAEFQILAFLPDYWTCLLQDFHSWTPVK